jgi:hypothetical protein
MGGLYGVGLYGVGLYGVDGSPFAVIGGAGYSIEAGSLSIESAIGRRSTASVTIRTDAPTYFPEDSQIALYNATATLIFAGYLSAPKYSKLGSAKVLYHPLSARDKHWLADKRRVVGSFVGYTGAWIARWIITNYLGFEGVTIGQIYDDNTISDTRLCSESTLCGEAIGVISSIVFDYCTASEAFDEIVKRISSSGIPFYWQIDYIARYWLVPYTAIINSTIIDGSTIDEVVNPPVVMRSNPRYRNSQILKGGFVETVPQSETRKGDGDTQSWPMRYAISRVPTVTVNSVAKTVGIRGVDSGKNFYWSKGEFEITQESGDTKLISSDTLAVSYVGMYKNTAIVSNSAQIALQASIDGSSGIVDEVEDIALNSLDAQLQVAGARLTRYAVQSPPTLEFTTRESIYQPGQLATVNLPDWSIDGQMLIESVSATDTVDGYNIYYSVRAISGPSDDTWVHFWGEITGSGNVSSSDDSSTTTIVTVSQSFSVAVSVDVSFTYTTFACPLCSNSTLCSDTTIIC